MKKLMCFIMAGFVTLSLTGCARGNNGMGNQNSGANDVRRIVLQDNTNINAGFRDGVYVGYGNEHNNRNERAMVTIQNGKISGIQLTNVAQYDISSDNNSGMGANNQFGVGTRRGAGNTGGMSSTPGAGTPGGTIGGNTGGLTGRTGAGSAGGSNVGTIDGRNLGSNTVGPMTGIPGNAINGLRANLVNLMIQNQGDNVTITNNDASTRVMINNWKLAVRRALDQAR